jgi:hypothetical protein
MADPSLSTGEQYPLTGDTLEPDEVPCDAANWGEWGWGFGA